MATHILVYDEEKTPLGLLPDFTNLATMGQLNDTGVMSFSYLPNGVNVGLLNADVLYLSLLEDGVESETRWMLDDDSDNTAGDRAGSKMIKVTARGVLAITDTAVVYPKAHVAGGPVSGLEPEHEFKNQTPGAIFVDLIRRAKNRGALRPLEVNFTATHDSFGRPWPKQYTVTYAAGMKYLELLRAAADNGWFDMRMRGFELQLAVPGGDLSRPTGVIFRNGQQVMSGPRKRSRRGIVTNILGIGSEKNMVEAGDASQAQKFGRREGQASDGRMTEGGSLLALAQNELERYKTAQEGFTLSVATQLPPGSTEKWWIPGQDFREGDWIQWDQIRKSSSEFEPLRCRSISYGYGDADAVRTCEVELNDLFVERTLKLDRQVQGIVQGSVTAAPPPTSTPGPDTTKPKPPPTLTATPAVYAVAGTHRVTVALSWSATTENVDGSVYEDHDSYLVGWSTDRGTSWSPESLSREPYVWISDLTPGSPLDVRVKTRDSSGNESDYTVFSIGDLPVDDVPPPRPSAPAVSTTLAVSTITWDGRTADGGQMPDDFAQVVCYTEGTEGSTELEEYRGRWVQRGFAIADGDTPTGGALHLYAVGIAPSTPQQTVLASPAGALWGPVAVTLSADAATHALSVDVAGAVTQVDLAAQGGVPFGQQFNLHLRAHRGRLVATVNETQVADVALPAAADYLATNPVDVTGITTTEASVDLLTYYPAGYPKRVGVLGSDAAPSMLTIAGQEYERAYTVWFVAEDRDGNRSDPSEPTTFASKPLVDADLIGTTVRDALAEANNQLATIPGELEALNRDVEAARVSADGKNTMHYGPDAPSGTAHRVGDTWFDSANGFRINRWSGTAWVPSLLAGTAMQDASITADKVLIGGANLAPDPGFARKEAWTGSTYVQPTGGRLAGGSLLIPATSTQTGTYMANGVTQLPYAIPVVEGQTYRVGAWMRFETAAPTAAGRATVYVKFWDPSTGTFTGNVLVVSNAAGVAADTWTWIEGTVTIPAGRTHLSVGCFKQATHTVGAVRFDGVVVQPMAGGSLIVDGAITTSKILAGTITAESGIIGSLDAGKITVGELDGTRIKAGTIAAEKLLIGRADNLVPNGAGEAQSNLGWGNLTWDAVDKPSVVPGTLRSAPGQGSLNLQTGQNASVWFDVQPWGEYLFEVWLKADKVGSRIYLELRDQSNAHAIGSSRRDPSDQYSLDPGAAPYLVTNLPLETQWVRYSRVITMSPTATRVRLGTVYFNHVNGTERGAVQWIAGVRIRPTTPGILLADGAITAGKVAAGAITADAIAAGAITAEKIKAGEITADKLAANAITADKIKAGAIDGQTITGAIIRTSDTDWRMEMDGSGLRGYGGQPEGTMTLTQFGIDANYGDFSSMDVGFLEANELRLTGSVVGEKSAEFAATSLMQLRARWAHAAETYGVDVESSAPTSGSGATRMHLRSQGVAAGSTLISSIETLSQYNNAGTDGLLSLVAPQGIGATANRQGAILLDGADVFLDAHHYSGSTLVGHPRRSLYRGSDWIPLDLLGNWTHYSDTATNVYARAAYKIIGSIVILRGLIKNVSAPGSGDKIAYLGPTLVPPNTFGANIFGPPGNGGAGEVQVNPMDYTDAEKRGFLVYRKGLSGTSNWLSLAGVWWPLY